MAVCDDTMAMCMRIPSGPMASAGYMKLEALKKMGEISYEAVMRHEHQERKREYFLSMIKTSDPEIKLKLRVIETFVDYQDYKEKPGDAWIRELQPKDDFTIDSEDDELLSYIWGLIPAADMECDIKEGEWENIYIEGIPGRYKVTLKKRSNPFGNYTLVIDLMKTAFMPEGFYNEMEYDFSTGLLIGLSKVDKNGFISIALLDTGTS